MSIKHLVNSLALASFALVSLHTSAGNIDAAAARVAANDYLKRQAAAMPGKFMSSTLTDLKLVHAEPSGSVSGANDYYAFNITGGGFVIVAGEDRATPVLGYSDQGRIDFNNLPAPLQDLLAGYKREIEFLQTYKGNDLVPAPANATFAATSGVGPLIKTTWGQEMPYYLQCPVYQGEYCVVGCVATAMAQVMNYWHYPTSSSSIASYYCYDIGQQVNALPGTTFDYSLMLDSYCHWDWDNSTLVQDVYTSEQAQEVAKLGRYCGQAVRMGYSPEGSGAYTTSQQTAMKNFGFSNASRTSKGYNSSSSSWDNLLKTELDAGRPILYSANDPSSGGHAFICDGYNSNGYFHFNLGWYGTCDGWYTTSALKMVHRDGDQLNFSQGHEIVYKVEPPDYCLINADEVTADKGLIILGDDLNAVASNVTIKTSYSNVNLLFTLSDEKGTVLSRGNAGSISKSSFEQGSTVTGKVALPADLTQGTYRLTFNYYITNANLPTLVMSSDGQLVVVGHIAKFGEAFDIDDVTTVINYVLGEPHNGVILDIDDVTALINHILN